MDVDVARTFLAILDTGNFLRAAEQLNVTQSTVSMRIKALEDSLGRVLFNRGRRGAVPTAAGQQFRPYAQAMVRAWEQARHEIALPEAFQEVLTVGGQFTLWDQMLLRWIAWLRTTLPNVAVRAEMSRLDGLIRQLSEGLLDIAVLYTPQARSGVTIEALMSDRLVLVAADPAFKGPQAPDYLLVDWSPEFRAAHSAAFTRDWAPALTVSHGSLALQYILDNGGGAFLPLRMVQPHLEAGRLHRVENVPVFTLPVYVVYANGRDDPRFMTALEGLRALAKGLNPD